MATKTKSTATEVKSGVRKSGAKWVFFCGDVRSKKYATQTAAKGALTRYVKALEKASDAITEDDKPAKPVVAPAPEPAVTTIAGRLAVAASTHGLFARDAARFNDVLADVNLTTDDMTEEVIETAHDMSRDAIARIRSKIEKHNQEVMRKGMDTESVVTINDQPVTVENVKTDNKQQRVAKKPARPTTGKRGDIFGHSATAVLRWMGKEGGWSKEDAGKAVRTMGGKDIADATVSIQLKAGAKGERGAPADITKKQAKELRAAAK